MVPLATRCSACSAEFRVESSKKDFLHQLIHDPQWRYGYPCVHMGCEGVAKVMDLAELKSPKVVDAYAYFRAINGLGLAEGAPAAALAVRAALVGKTIKTVSVEPTGDPERTIVHAIETEDGVRLFFGASSKGACIFYMEVRSDRATEVDSEGHVAHRAQGRHPGESAEDPEPAAHEPQSDRPGDGAEHHLG